MPESLVPVFPRIVQDPQDRQEVLRGWHPGRAEAPEECQSRFGRFGLAAIRANGHPALCQSPRVPERGDEPGDECQGLRSPPATRRRSRSEAFAKALAKVIAKALAEAKASCRLLGGVLVNREFLAGSSRDPQDLDGFAHKKLNKQNKTMMMIIR